MVKYLVIVPLVFCMAHANLVTNGDFEQEISVGWTQMSTGGNTLIDRSPYYDPDPDYEARVYKYASNGYGQLYQKVDVVNTDIEFSCSAKLGAFDNNPGDWGAGALILSYMDATSEVLGETRIYRRSDADCPWVDGPNLHLIMAPDENWNDYAFNITDELQNIAAIDPIQVTQIQVSMYDTTKYCGS